MVVSGKLVGEKGGRKPAQRLCQGFRQELGQVEMELKEGDRQVLSLLIHCLLILRNLHVYLEIQDMLYRKGFLFSWNLIF